MLSTSGCRNGWPHYRDQSTHSPHEGMHIPTYCVWPVLESLNLARIKPKLSGAKTSWPKAWIR